MQLEDSVHLFQATYDKRDYSGAANIFLDALNLHPSNAYRHFAIHVSSQLSEVMSATKRIKEFAQIMNDMFPTNPQMNILNLGDYENTVLIDRLRNENIDKGLPSILLATQGKSGSISVSNIFNSGFHLPSISYALINQRVVPNWTLDYMRGGACHVTHLYPYSDQAQLLKEGGVDRMFVHVRDPRQTLVSLVHHLEKYPTQLGRLRDMADQGNSVSEKALMVLPFYRNAIRWIDGWVKLSEEIPITFSTFEDMVDDWEAFVEKYLENYGGPREHFSMENATPLRHDTDYHFREGRPDEWRGVFSANESKMLSDLLPEHLKVRFDWRE
ncbi:MAG: hypothetical protein Q7S99_13095 [Parvibaculum sp.]|nr:hypothetical protein [Parvibaculum sp.]